MNANEKASRSKYALLFYSLLLRVTPTVVAKSQVVVGKDLLLLCLAAASFVRW